MVVMVGLMSLVEALAQPVLDIQREASPFSVSVIFPTRMNHEYQVQRSLGLDEWEDWGERLIGIGGELVVNDPSAQAVFGHYRVIEYPSGEGLMLIPDFGLELRRLPPGTFLMGSPASESGREESEGPQLEVTLTKPIWIGVTEVTQAQYRVVTGSNPSSVQGDALPVHDVSWEDAVAFCQQLTEREWLAGRLPETSHYRLPTEAEWEYAARGGTVGLYFWGDDETDLAMMERYAVYGLTSGFVPWPVASREPNPFGLYDTAGNVFEWCGDVYAPYPAMVPVDPVGPADGDSRVIRGGAWLSTWRFLRSAARSGFMSNERNGSVGFRIVREEGQESESGGANPVEPDPGLEPEAPPLPRFVDGVRVVLSRRISFAKIGYGVVAPAGSRTVLAPPVAFQKLPTTSIGETFERWEIEDLGLTFVKMPRGQFSMGSPNSEEGRVADEGPQTAVTITRDLWFAEFELTQAQYETIMGDNPSSFVGLNRPVHDVSWDDAIRFCEILTERERSFGRLGPESVLRLPTEAEWEYAARAGTDTRFYWGEDPDFAAASRFAVYGMDSGPMSVGGRVGNAFGLFDLAGNVAEWCWDFLGDYSGAEVINPRGQDLSDLRAFRGGSWSFGGSFLRSAVRGSFSRDAVNPAIGFRVIRDDSVGRADFEIVDGSGASEPVLRRSVTAIVSFQKLPAFSTGNEGLDPGTREVSTVVSFEKLPGLSADDLSEGSRWVGAVVSFQKLPSHEASASPGERRVFDVVSFEQLPAFEGAAIEGERRVLARPVSFRKLVFGP